jgi:hypothetical protein
MTHGASAAVMPALVAGIHAVERVRRLRPCTTIRMRNQRRDPGGMAWMAGTSPATTESDVIGYSLRELVLVPHWKADPPGMKPV